MEFIKMDDHFLPPSEDDEITTIDFAWFEQKILIIRILFIFPLN